MPQVLAALAIAQAAAEVFNSISSAVATANSEGRDLTPAEWEALTSKKQSADALAEAELTRLRKKYPGLM